MPMPSVPFPYLVLCQTELLLGRLEARLNLPARSRHPHHLLQRGALLGGENHVVSELVRILYAPPHQQPMAPKHLLFAQLQAVQWQECPVVEAWALGALARRKTPPVLGGGALGDTIGPNLPWPKLGFRPQGFGAPDRQDEGLPASLKKHPEPAVRPVDGVARHPPCGHAGLQPPLQHPPSELRLCGEAHLLWDARLRPTLSVFGPVLR